MENGEKLFTPKEEVDEGGYSEKKLDQAMELQAGQWLDLSHTKKKASQKQPKATSIKIPGEKQSAKKIGKILAQLQIINQNLQATMADFMGLSDFDSDQAEKKLQNILELQILQKALLKALKWEEKGELDASKLPKQLQNLLK